MQILNRFLKFHKTILFGIILCTTLLIGFSTSDSDYFFKVNKGIEIFGQVYKEIALKYVDEIDPEKFIQFGIKGMLSALDPYTTYISEEESDEIDLITSGKYGGIGVTISLRDGYITVISLIEGYSARRQGIQPGDRIIEIDGKSTAGMKPENVRAMIRGTPGSEVKLKIEREGEAEPLIFVLLREEIRLKNIAYADFVSDSIAYIKLERFSRTAGDDLRLAIKNLKLKAPIQGVILDLRDNPGGLLDEAVDISEKFVPKGSLIVSTRGRNIETEKKYFSAEEPLLAGVPLIVIINRNSASASEIVAGAVQDLDRGLILGTRSFGKGLVQSVVPLVYNTQLKMTTAKYYTPSGRCIQEIDYMRKDKGGVFTTMPDTVKNEFKTTKGRSVYDHGGVYPDTVVEEPEQSTLQKELLRKSMYLKFANKYTLKNKTLPSNPDLNNQLWEEFKRFLDEQRFTYQDEIEKKLSELKELIQKRQMNEMFIADIDRLQKQLEMGKKDDIEKEKPFIINAVYSEIMRIYKGEIGQIEASLMNDIQVKTALKLLQSPNDFKRLLETKRMSN